MLSRQRPELDGQCWQAAAQNSHLAPAWLTCWFQGLTGHAASCWVASGLGHYLHVTVSPAHGSQRTGASLTAKLTSCCFIRRGPPNAVMKVSAGHDSQHARASQLLCQSHLLSISAPAGLCMQRKACSLQGQPHCQRHLLCISAPTAVCAQCSGRPAWWQPASVHADECQPALLAVTSPP